MRNISASISPPTHLPTIIRRSSVAQPTQSLKKKESKKNQKKKKKNRSRHSAAGRGCQLIFRFPKNGKRKVGRSGRQRGCLRSAWTCKRSISWTFGTQRQVRMDANSTGEPLLPHFCSPPPAPPLPPLPPPPPPSSPP